MSRGTEKNAVNLSQDIQWPGLDLNRTLPEYNSETLDQLAWCPVKNIISVLQIDCPFVGCATEGKSVYDTVGAMQ
jgi:hypothetical protein